MCACMWGGGQGRAGQGVTTAFQNEGTGIEWESQLI